MNDEQLEVEFRRWIRRRRHGEVPAGFADRVMRGLSSRAPRRAPRRVPRWGRAGLASAAAVAFLIRLYALASLFLV